MKFINKQYYSSFVFNWFRNMWMVLIGALSKCSHDCRVLKAPTFCSTRIHKMSIQREEIQLTAQQETVVKAFLKKYPKADRPTAIKFCFGRKFEIQRIFPLYEAYLKIIEERGLQNLTAASVLAEMKTEKMYIPGSRDKKGAALFVVQASKHVPGQFPPESTLKLAFFLGECITANLKTQRNGVTLLIDLHDTEWNSFDSAFMADLIGFFQNHIPAAVKNILIWRAPWWIKSAIKIVSPFLKEKMRNRIKLCDNLFALKGFVEEDQLPEEFGGSFEYDHQSFIRRQLAQTANENADLIFVDFDGAVETIPLSANSKLMVAVEDEKLLQAERTEALKAADVRLNALKDVSSNQSDFPLPIYEIMHNRACRMTLDATVTFNPIEGCKQERRKSLVEETWMAVRSEPDETIQISRMKEAILRS